jgi:hypothetical protein
MSGYEIRALDASTWDAFARLVEKHNGCGFGGCWCTWFHTREGRPEGEKGKAHAALVFDGDAAIAWCQYGSPEELPRIYHRKEWEAGLTGEPPAYRITCIFVDRDYRQKGVATAAVRGALDLIANEGGGVVEGYPHDLQGEKMRSQFLYSATRSLFEDVGFSYERPKGKKNCVMRRKVSPAKARRRARVA